MKEMEEEDRLLIVDDDINSSKSLELVLKKKGYELDIARTGQEAKDKINDRFYNVVILDIKLPDMEGTELLACLKERHPEMDVIMMTGYASVENAVLALNKGATAFITKPLKMDELLAKVKELIEKQRLIKEKRQAEEQLKLSLKEKEILLREIHHRVKNNMQIVHSLLSLQSEKVKNKSILNMLKETQHRVKSMALVHERLYQSEDLSRIEFGDYVRNLVSNLFNSYKLNTGSVKQEIDIDNVFLDINSAIPCGLIINELVSNSMKYAFPKGSGVNRKGNNAEIYVGLRSDKKNKYTLVVGDNGVGFPKDLDFRNTDSLGLQIVNTLVDQLEGNIRLKKENGTTFEIEFTSE